MADTFDKKTRSWIMSRVLSKGTTPELAVRKFLRCSSVRFRSHDKKLPGQPDFVLPCVRVAVFVNGCFWHWHGCKRSRMPSSNFEYWKRKLNQNVARDRRAKRALSAEGWHYCTIWECSIPSGLRRLLRTIQSLQAEEERGVDNKEAHANCALGVPGLSKQ